MSLPTGFPTGPRAVIATCRHVSGRSLSISTCRPAPMPSPPFMTPTATANSTRTSSAGRLKVSPSRIKPMSASSVRRASQPRASSCRPKARPRRSILIIGANVEAANSRLDAAPDIARGLDDQLELGDLVCDGELVAALAAGEAALRTQGELIQGHDLGRGVDAA